MAVRKSLCRYYRWLRRHGCNDSHSGNISARDGDGFWLTPTGACADTLMPQDLVFCPLDGDVPSGASGDARLHQAVYRTNTRAGAVIHSHGPYTVAMTLHGEDFVPPDFEGQLYFPRVPVLQVPYAVYFEQAAGHVARALAESCICVVRGHGVYAWGEDLNQAYKWTCSLELSAKTAWIARLAGTLPK